MAVIGDFCGWVEPGVPMAKNADGKWEVAVKSTMDGVLKYKFWYKGTYIYDFKSPDKIDDGFGGNNGLIEVSKVLAKQKAKELAASGDAAGAAALLASAGGGDSGLKFQTWSMLGFQTKFDTVDAKNDKGVQTDDKGLDSAGINLKSYWKASGKAVPNMPIYIEVAVAEQDGFNNLYQEGAFKKGVKQDTAREWKDGLTNLLVDTIFDPVYYFGGQNAGATYLGHFKAGFENDWFTYTTGYKYAKLPSHSNVSWTTVDQEWEAGYNQVGGFSQFATNNSTTEMLNDLLGVKIKAAVAPNKAADRAGGQYGMYAWASAEVAGQYIDFQYNGAYGKTFDSVFGHIYETDLILGYQGKFGPVTAKVNGLLNMYGDGDLSVNNNKIFKSKYVPTSGVGPVDPAADFIDNVAVNTQIVYSDDYVDGTLAFRARGTQAGMMYVEEGADNHTNVSNQLGDLNTMKAWLNVNYKLNYGNVGIEPYMVATLNKESKLFFANDKQMEIGGKVFGGYDFDVVKFDAYANAKFLTAGTGKDKDNKEVKDVFSIGDIGLKVSTPLVMNGLALVLGYDPADTDADFITGIFELGLPAGINAQAGMGYRAAKANDKGEVSKTYEGKELGFFIGANMKLTNVPQKPVLYTQFVWNMDPYKGFGDGQDNLNLDGYVLDSGVSNYAGAGAFRVALRWDI